jgi:histidinol dehydrogenase
MIPTLRLADAADRARAQSLLDRLRLKPADVVLGRQQDVAAVTAILADVAARGDDAIVDSARKFDDPNFTAEQIKVRPDEMADQLTALRRSIAQVREYQQHILPTDPAPLRRPGVELGLRYTPLDSAGCYFPGGKAAYPSSLIMLSVPAQVAGVKRVVVCTPPSKFGKSDLVLATCTGPAGRRRSPRWRSGRRRSPPSTRSSAPATGTCSSPSGRSPASSGSTGSSGRARSS